MLKEALLFWELDAVSVNACVVARCVGDKFPVLCDVDTSMRYE